MKIIRSSPGIGFLDSRYVNVTGDTMTGVLVMTDDISLVFGDLVSEQNPDAVDAIRLKGTASDVGVVLGAVSGYFLVWNVADDTPVFYVNNDGDTDITGGLTTIGTGIFRDDVFFEGEDSGLLFAEIYAFDTNTTITIAGTGIANKVQVTSFAVDGLSNGMTPDHTNDHITVVKAGKYKVNVSISAESAGGTAYEVGFGVFKNNGATHFTNCHAHRNLAGGGGDTGSISMTGIIDLAINDTIEVWVWNETNTNDIIVDDITMNLVELGGT